METLDLKAFFVQALAIFNHQKQHCEIYADYLRAINFDREICSITDFPFLPISFFKSHKVVSSQDPIQLTFKSSGTTGDHSFHHVSNRELYIQSLEQCFVQEFHHFDYSILALLPSYLEQGGSSLVYMVNHLMEKSPYDSAFFLHDFEGLANALEHHQHLKIPTILIGVTYALIDFAQAYPMALGDHIVIMETGGMKGRKQELNRDQVHDILTRSFHKNRIASEYGMTELMSQAYSHGNGIFKMNDRLRILLRDEYDPLSNKDSGRGAVNIIDLSNSNSCSFIATQDLGEIVAKDTFKIHGRMDTADLRGCSLMLQ